MKRIWYLIGLVGMLFLIMPIAGCTINTGPKVTQDFDFRNFNQVQISNAFEVTINKADTYKISVTFQSDLVQFLDVHLNGTLLVIGMKPGSFSYRGHPKAVITMPDLLSVDLSGAVTATVGNFNAGNRLDVSITAAANLKLVNIQSGDTKFVISSAGNVSGSVKTAVTSFNISSGSKVGPFTGSASNVTMDVSGGSQVNLPEFSLFTANVTAGGGSRVNIMVSAEMDANLSSGAILNYSGNPALKNVNISGGASLNHK